jgi:hypothetical protein
MTHDPAPLKNPLGPVASKSDETRLESWPVQLQKRQLSTSFPLKLTQERTSHLLSVIRASTGLEGPP